TELGTAARDPLFFAHHANIDRLWELWRGDRQRRATEPVDPAFLQRRFPFPWLDGTIITLSVAETLDTRRLGYVYDQLDVTPVSEIVAGHPMVPVQTLVLPTHATELRITGVAPGERPISLAIALARSGHPASAITVGAYAVGRRHNPPSFPDTELRFAITG